MYMCVRTVVENSAKNGCDSDHKGNSTNDMVVDVRWCLHHHTLSDFTFMLVFGQSLMNHTAATLIRFTQVLPYHRKQPSTYAHTHTHAQFHRSQSTNTYDFMLMFLFRCNENLRLTLFRRFTPFIWKAHLNGTSTTSMTFTGFLLLHQIADLGVQFTRTVKFLQIRTPANVLAYNVVMGMGMVSGDGDGDGVR